MNYSPFIVRIIDKFLLFVKTDRAILVLSISIALFFWFFTKMAKNYETERQVFIVFELPERKTFLNPPPEKIIANIKGGGWNLFFNWLRGKKLSIQFPLENIETQYISSSSVVNKLSATIGSKYEVLNVDSDVITIKLDDEKTKKVPVELHLDETISNGYMAADSIKIEPLYFTVSGPKSIIDGLDVYPTEKMIAHHLTGPFSASIKAKRPFNPQLKIAPKTIRVAHQIEKYTEGELVVPIQIVNAVDSITILPTNVFIKYRAALSVFSKITVADFKVVANFDNSFMGSTNNTLALELVQQPNFTKVVAMNPPTIEYYVERDTLK